MGTKVNTTAKPSSVEIIPSTQLTGIESALSQLSIAEAQLAVLKPRAEAIVVDSPQKFLEGGALLKEIRDLKKMGTSYMKPFKDIVKRATDYLRNKETAHELVASQIEQPLQIKLETYQRLERERKDKEQRENNDRLAKEQRERAEADRIAAKAKADQDKAARIAGIKEGIGSGEIGKREGARLLKEAGDEAEAAKMQADLDADAAKNAPPPVQKVLSNTPAVSGLRRRVKWDFTIKDASKLKREYLMPNEVEIGRDVRSLPGTMEDATFEQIKAAIEAKCPGIEVTWEDKI